MYPLIGKYETLINLTLLKTWSQSSPFYALSQA